MNSKHVEVRYGDAVLTRPAGIRVDELVAEVEGGLPGTVLAALVNRRLVMLDFPLRGRVELELIRYGHREAESVYKRSVALLLAEAAWTRCPGLRLVVGQSLGNCWHYQVRGESPPLADLARELLAGMVELRRSQRPFLRQTVTLEEIEDLFRARGLDDKLQLLETRRSSTVHTIRVGEFVDIAHGPYAPHTGCLVTFGLEPYEDGLLLRFPRRADREALPPFAPRPLLFRTAIEARSWQELLGVHNVGQLNRLCLNGGVRQILRVAEGLHEKKIAQVADQILARRDRVRLITIAGPSSSGKTTFAKRLGIQLRVNGIEPVSLSLDNFYVDRERTPRAADGSWDFEALEAIELDLFHRQLADLLAGREVRTPRYDFVSGARVAEEQWAPMRLGRDQVLVIEGIHGLNPRLAGSVPPDRIFRVFVSALSQLALDDHHRLLTSDARLVRRIVRDTLSRGFTAERTLSLWESVRRGEARWIFPYQEQADVMFDSALVYEPAVLRTYAERFLLTVRRTSPHYPEAYRLLKGLSVFVPIFPDEVPHTSILREFIGGSTFSY